MVPVSIDSPVLKGTESPAYFSRVMTNVVQKSPYLGSEGLPLLAIRSLSNHLVSPLVQGHRISQQTCSCFYLQHKGSDVELGGQGSG